MSPACIQCVRIPSSLFHFLMAWFVVTLFVLVFVALFFLARRYL